MKLKMGDQEFKMITDKKETFPPIKFSPHINKDSR